MNQNYFKTKYVLYTISDATQKSQYFQMLTFGKLGSLGAKDANQLNVNSRIMTWDFQPDRANLLFPEQQVNADFSFVQGMIAVANFSISFNVFMSDRENLNAKY